MTMPTIFANSGKQILYSEIYHKIIQCGIDTNGDPYVELDPSNDELEERIIDEIREKGNLPVRIGSPYKLVLGVDEYPYFR